MVVEVHMGFSCIYKVIPYMISSILSNFIHCLTVSCSHEYICSFSYKLYPIHDTLANYSKYLLTTSCNRGYLIIIHSKALSVTCYSSVYLIKVSPHFAIIYLHNILYDDVVETECSTFMTIIALNLNE